MSKSCRTCKHWGVHSELETNRLVLPDAMQFMCRMAWSIASAELHTSEINQYHRFTGPSEGQSCFQYVDYNAEEAQSPLCPRKPVGGG